MKKTTIIMITISACMLLVASASQAEMPNVQWSSDAPTWSNINFDERQEMLDDTPHQPAEGVVVQDPDISSATGLDCHIAIIGEDTDCFVLNELNQPQNDADCDCYADDDDVCPDDFDPEQEVNEFGDGLACTDTDGDGVMDLVDNCRDVPNPGQEDNDRTTNGIDNPLENDDDGIGDACEDSDHDGWQDEEDNCPYDYNTPQGDMDEDGIGNACDNCPLVDNPSQLDTDFDEKGDACSDDDDGDGTVDSIDNCPVRYNPDQDDMDGDGIGDPCDNCMDVPNGDQLDSDNNDIGDACENIPSAATTTPVNNFDDGSCTLGTATGGNPASLIILALALVPAIMTRRRKS